MSRRENDCDGASSRGAPSVQTPCSTLEDLFMRKLSWFALLSIILLVAGCIDDIGFPDTSTTSAHATGPVTFTTNKASYQYADPIVASWMGAPGNATDWIALAPAGSPYSTDSGWGYMNGATSGSKTFSGPPGGSYVLRAFSSDSYTLIGESDPFTVASPPAAGSVTLAATATTYGMSDPITITFSGLPGNATDWIAIAPEGFDPMDQADWLYTGGGTSGSVTFVDGLAATSFPAGRYVARAYVNDTFTLVGESAPFAIGTAVFTDQTAYQTNELITVGWQNLPGASTEWVAIAPAGSPSSTTVAWVFTGGQQNGSTTFTGLTTAGTYVARAFVDEQYTLAAESAPFTVAAATAITVTTNSASYTPGQSITVSWTGLPANANDWIALAPAGSSAPSVIRWVYTGGTVSGSATFATGLTSAGTYVARAFANDSYVLLGESSPFSVTASAAVVTSTSATYAPNQDVTVTWTGLPTNAQDWVAIAPAGSNDTTVTRWVYTGGQSSGGTTFAGGLGTAGSYVVRAFLNDTYTKLAESTPFTVQ